MSAECLRKRWRHGTVKKGDVLGGGAEWRALWVQSELSELIPLCHILNLTKCAVEFTMHPEVCAVVVNCLRCENHRKDRGGDGGADRCIHSAF